MKTALTASLISLALLSSVGLARAQSVATVDLERPGPYRTGTDTRVWRDSARSRRLRVQLHYPRPIGTAPPRAQPVIVFSHGLGGDPEGYRYFGEHLASHGFLVILPQHAGSDSVVAQQGPAALIAAGAALVNRIDRPLDMGFVLDRVQALRSRDPVLRYADMSKVGVAGHSFGAYTALAAVGQTTRQNGCTLGFRDRRVRCALAMSSQGPGTLGLTPRSWQDITVPVLTMTGTKDVGLGTKDVADRRAAFEGMPQGDKFHLTIKDAEHLAFSNSTRPGTAPRDPRHHSWILAAATGFFRATLKGERGALDWLTRKQLQRDTMRAVRQEQR
jgi:predicted dienelactone hydrolase